MFSSVLGLRLSISAHTSDPRGSCLLAGLFLWTVVMEQSTVVSKVLRPSCGYIIMTGDSSVTSNLCVSVCGPVSENRSVVLASTAIQLLDERKSPIAAGRWLSLSHTLQLFLFMLLLWTVSNPRMFTKAPLLPIFPRTFITRSLCTQVRQKKPDNLCFYSASWPVHFSWLPNFCPI